MKIAFLSTFYPFRGGIAQFNASLYKALGEEHEVKAFTFKRQYPDFLFPGETQYVTEKDNKADKIESIEVLDTINPLSYFKTAKQINDFAPDILIMKYWMSFFGPSLGTVAKYVNKNTKVITILDNVIPHEKRIIDKPFTSYFFNQNDGFIAMSESVKQDLLSMKPKNPTVILEEHPLYDHFGAKQDKRVAQEKLKLDSTKKTLLFFGFIRKYKGLDLLIKAFNLLDDSYQLVIAGETYGSFDEYQLLIDQSEGKERIHIFNQYIGDEDVPVFFSACDACILPYKSATQSGITSISYHFDLPIVATDTGGLKETVLHEENGIVVSEVNEKAIAEGIQLFFEGDRVNRFSASIAQMKVEKSWPNFANKLIEFSKTL